MKCDVCGEDRIPIYRNYNRICPWCEHKQKEPGMSEKDSIRAAAEGLAKSIGLHPEYSDLIEQAIRDAVERVSIPAQKLVDKLDEVDSSPQMNAVWTLAYTHGNVYKGGPTYGDELQTLRTTLDRIRKGE